jgi:hypothetical protein
MKRNHIYVFKDRGAVQEGLYLGQISGELNFHSLPFYNTTSCLPWVTSKDIQWYVEICEMTPTLAECDYTDKKIEKMK